MEKRIGKKEFKSLLKKKGNNISLNKNNVSVIDGKRYVFSGTDKGAYVFVPAKDSASSKPKLKKLKRKPRPKAGKRTDVWNVSDDDLNDSINQKFFDEKISTPGIYFGKWMKENEERLKAQNAERYANLMKIYRSIEENKTNIEEALVGNSDFGFIAGIYDNEID